MMTALGWQPTGTTAVSYSYSTLTDPSSGIPPNLTDDTFAGGINNAGQIVGYYGVQTGNLGFLYENGNYSTIAIVLAQGTILTGVNDTGEIVG